VYSRGQSAWSPAGQAADGELRTLIAINYDLRRITRP
jgi:hypothetical protein